MMPALLNSTSSVPNVCSRPRQSSAAQSSALRDIGLHGNAARPPAASDGFDRVPVPAASSTIDGDDRRALRGEKQRRFPADSACRRP